MAPEGAAQLCQDNLACLGFSVNADGMSGSFVSTPTSDTTIVDSAGVGASAFYVKGGFNIVAYVRFRGMKSGSPLSISKVAFYKGSTLSTFTLNAGNSYEINAEGGQVSTPQTIGWELANLVKYNTTAGWKATGVDGFMLRFETPLLFDGYTFVTTSLSSASDPTAWIVETSMNGKDWVPFDVRTGVTPPAARFAVYPVFKPSKDSGVSTDFIAKTLDTCKIQCKTLLPNMTSLYLTQTNNSANNFFVDLIGYDPTNNQCLLGWDDAAGNSQVTGFVFKPVFGECDNISESSNITIKRGLTATGLTRIPDTGQFRYIRFKPTALNGGTGTSLAFIGFLYEGKLLVPDGVTNMAGTDLQNADGIIDITLSTQWKFSGMGNLIFNFNTPSSADSFTMITGSDPTCAPVSWILESSPDMIIWSVLHEQKSPVTVPARGKQYQIYYFNGTVQTPAKGILDKTIKDAGYTCASNEIINGDGGKTVSAGVNDEAFNRSIFFNPLSYTYDNIRNQCNYLQGTDGSTLTVTFSTIVSRSSSIKTNGFITTVTNITTSSTPLIGATPFTAGLQGIGDCDPQPARYSCNNQELLDKINTAYKLAPINQTKAPLSAVATGYNATRNECLFELDDMYAPLNGSGGLAIPSKQIGFQIKKNIGCTVPGAQALIVDTAVPTGETLTKASTPSGPFTFIRFKVTQGGLKIGPFEFFKSGIAQSYSATVSNPLGTYAPTNIVGGLQSFTDSSTKPKPIQFQFSSPLSFDGYSWTTAGVAGADPVAWTLQTSVNGYIWTDLDVRSDASTKTRNFKMPIYGLNGSVTARQVAVAQTYSLRDRGIDCNKLDATTAIVNSKGFSEIATSNGFSTDTSNLRMMSTSNGNNTCTFTFTYSDDPSSTTYNAVVTYAMATSITDKTTTITNISVS
jgi:hypothetical protein